jgi:hypothetical protein
VDVPDRDVHDRGDGREQCSRKEHREETPHDRYFGIGGRSD